MLLASAHAPGKIILFGEHAVVYGRPALAVPVTEVQATASVEALPPGSGWIVNAADLHREVRPDGSQPPHPLAVIVELTLGHLGLAMPDWRITVRSTIPVAGGLGSGAAVSTAVARAMAAAAGRELAPAQLAVLVYETEKLHHGTPSGIDNTVIAYGQPVYFVRGRQPEPFAIGRSFMLAIADSGIASPTRVTVGDVRSNWQAEPARYEALFDQVAGIVERARTAIAAGRPADLGPLLDENHRLLGEIGVSCPELDRLVEAARAAGALGAKLSGGGRGGNVIALVAPGSASAVSAALSAAGAVRVIVTTVEEQAS